MGLSFSGPRYSLRTVPFGAVVTAVQDYGFCVLENACNPEFLSDLRIAVATTKDASDDAKIEVTKHTMAVLDLEHYYGNLLYFFKLPDGPALERRFFVEFERAGFPALFRHAITGDFVLARGECLLRRTDPKLPLRFAGLHFDGQLGLCSKAESIQNANERSGRRCTPAPTPTRRAFS